MADETDERPLAQPKFRLTIDQSKCDRCESRPVPLCTQACPKNAIYPCVNTNYIWAICEASSDSDLCRECLEACPKQAIRVLTVPEVIVEERSVTYFKKPGVQNTQRVVDVIARRVAKGDIETLVVASCSGSSALLLAEALVPQQTKIVNLSAPRNKINWHPIPSEMADRLSQLGVTCRAFPLPNEQRLRSFPANTPFYDPLTCSTSNIEQLERVFLETLIYVGGMGLKTAVECVLPACVCGEVSAGNAVVGTAGSGWGLDTAAVIRATTPMKCFSEKPSDRMEIQEILAMPIEKQRWG